MPLFNGNAWVEVPRPGQLDLIDVLFEDKKIFAPTRPAAIVQLEAKVVAATADLEYDAADVTISVDQLQAVVGGP